MRRRVGAALLLLVLAGIAGSPAAAAGHLSNETIERRTDAIAAELRCPVCQNLSVKDSPSDVAESFRARIRELVAAGKSDDEVKAFFVARYGEWILLSPPKRGIGLAVWIAPALAVLAGLSLAIVAVARWTSRGRRVATPISSDRVERELADLDEQLASGDLEPGDHERLRRRLLARPASPAPRHVARSGRSWRWPLAGAASAAIIAAILVPALRQRGASDFPTGNDFGARQEDSAWLVEWRAAEQATEAGRSKEALSRYRLAVAFAPDVAELRARFGFALASAGRNEQALEQLRRAVRDEPALPTARLYLGAVLFKSARREAALLQWRRYLELEPDGEGAKLVRRLLAGKAP